MKKLYSTFLLIILLINSYAQLPGYLKLYHIQTPHYDLIFPKEIEQKAQEIANFLELTYPANTATLHSHPRRLKIILNNQTTISNGYVTLGPRYSQWYLTPYPQIGLGITEWTQTLSIHEMRHNIQYNALDKNFNKLMHIFGGQYGLSGAIFWSVPMWFYEGDAVFQETILSKSGRGRIGHFAMPVKAIALEFNKKDLNYYKFFYRSYKTFYPNHYYLGYYLVTYINKHYGPEQWHKILWHSTNIAFLPNAMNISLKKYTGLNYKRLFDSTMTELKQYWSIDTTQKTNFKSIPHKKKRTFTNYYNARFINDSTIIFLKSGFDNINGIYTLNLNTNKEDFICFVPSNNFSYNGNAIVWAEQNPNIRWSDSYYSNIVIRTLNKNKKIYISKNGRYFSPEISQDGKIIVAVELTKNLVPKIVLFDTQTYKKFKEYQFPGFNFIRYPRFGPDNNLIIFTATNQKGNGLFILNSKTYNIDTIIEPTYNLTISNPQIWKNYIIFTSDLNKSENIFAIDINTKITYQITNAPYGATLSDINEATNQALLSNYTTDGYDIAILSLNSTDNWKKVDINNPNLENYFLSDKTQNLINDYTENFKPKNFYQIKPYKRAAHLINPHSWIPDITINKDTSLTASINIYSTDVLRELSLNYSTEYLNTGQITNAISLTYRHYLPVIELNFKHIRNWTENKTLLKGNFNFSMPLNLSKYVWTRYLTIRQTNNITFNPEIPARIFSSGGNLSFYNALRRSYRDPEARFSQSVYFDFDHNLQGSQYQITSINNFNFPGLLKHDIFKINFSLQKITGTIYPNQITLPAGYSNISYNQITKLRLAYHVPLFYPDWGAYPLFNLKRIRSKLFYDLAFINNNTKYSSIGLQILADFNLFGFNIDFGAGIQFAYTLENQKLHLAPIIDYSPLN